VLVVKVTWLAARPGAAMAARWTMPVTFSTRSSIIEKAAIASPKSVTSARAKRTSPGRGGLCWPGGGARSTEVTS
jgi:hypothetical protein